MVRDVEERRVHPGARRMVRRDVERVEVVPLVLDLRPLDDPVAHPREDVDDRLDDRRMERSARIGRPAT
jgi:hypothetical protein